MVALFASCVFAYSISLLYMEVWWRLRSVVALTFCLSWCEGRVKACIWRRSTYGIVHHRGRRVACLGLVARADVGVVELAVYMTQNGGRGAMAPTSTLIFWS